MKRSFLLSVLLTFLVVLTVSCSGSAATPAPIESVTPSVTDDSQATAAPALSLTVTSHTTQQGMLDIPNSQNVYPHNEWSIWWVKITNASDHSVSYSPNNFYLATEDKNIGPDPENSELYSKYKGCDSTTGQLRPGDSRTIILLFNLRYGESPDQLMCDAQ